MEPGANILKAEQVAIIIFSCPAIWLVGRREQWRRWGYVLGLAGQPFWLYATWRQEQWGMFAVSLWYCYAWLQGVCNFWRKR